MKPILITLLLTPLFVLVVAIVYLWWQRASAVASTRRRVLAWLLGATFVLGPLGIWYWSKIARNNFDFWWLLCFGLSWAYAVVDGARRLRNDYRNKVSQ